MKSIRKQLKRAKGLNAELGIISGKKSIYTYVVDLGQVIIYADKDFSKKLGYDDITGFNIKEIEWVPFKPRYDGYSHAAIAKLKHGGAFPVEIIFEEAGCFSIGRVTSTRHYSSEPTTKMKWDKGYNTMFKEKIDKLMSTVDPENDDDQVEDLNQDELKEFVSMILDIFIDKSTFSKLTRRNLYNKMKQLKEKTEEESEGVELVKHDFSDEEED